ncbi:Methyltransferase domain-containing protein [Filimonas lacunae]|uniref:Methyltransferase domain-containing protein n=1 Tax=Filimonas lacunae TaxID=477680 RepID=A0A173MHF7_9BACT|nr:class I SAM-dependent methyltransferase [Filimonas lacunae]BAV07054.1 hypothetical protein FLA_3074 [Filimonas lacunae]SIS95636.1 Methyltransferase domain-containing protein [Filimonas lacunae]
MIQAGNVRQNIMTNEIKDTSVFSTDVSFDDVYPREIRRLSKSHWTSVEVAKKAASFLAEIPGSCVLDIGSGVGKFCLNAGHYYRDSHFFGVEQRSSLVEIAKETQQLLGIQNVTFINANFTQLDFSEFDHFYFFNSFYENLTGEQDWIDDYIDHSESLYNYYTGYLYKMLETRPPGTRLVTYQSLFEEIPSGYQVVENDLAILYNCWIKTE